MAWRLEALDTVCVAKGKDNDACGRRATFMLVSSTGDPKVPVCSGHGMRELGRKNRKEAEAKGCERTAAK